MDLSGVRVLDLTRLLPGPYATQLLADAGADVVKVESPDRGDYARTMPPTTEDGVSPVFDALAREADAVVEGFSPGTAERLGVGHERLRELNPELVYCSLSGYGGTGPRRDHPGHDLNYVATTGLLDMTRADDGERPRIPGVPVADMAGGQAAAFAIVAGLLSRELGNGGCYVDTSLAEAALSVTQPVAALAFDGDPRPGGTPLTGELPWYDVYEAGDGRYVTLAALEEPFWQAFCEAADRPNLVGVHGTTDPDERAALREALTDLFAERSAAGWERLCGDTGMVARVRTPAEAVADEGFRDRGVVHDGRVGFPGRVDGTVPETDETVPNLGEHTESVLSEVGFDPDRLT